MPRRVRGLAADGQAQPLHEWEFDRRDLRPDDVAVTVDFCGVCHSDVHAWHGEPSYGGATFPLVPGHEFVGTVAEVGGAVTEFAVGDKVAVGNIVDSCRVCQMCTTGHEQLCVDFPTLTYGGVDRRDGLPTYGGYSTEYVVTEGFVYHLPDGLDPAGAAPLMCAGVTVWEPLAQYKISPGMTVGIVGLGGLGHLALKFAHALGADVHLFTTSPAKGEAARALGASDVVVSTHDAQMADARGRYDFILDTVPVSHDISNHLATVRPGGTLCQVGALDAVTFEPAALLGRSVAMSGSGGRPGTRQMLDFCAAHGITADVEVLPATAVNDALARLERNDVRFRFSLDMTTMR
ncbi:NAD(P)-dependent alcohol dehydrogenase [Mycobacterium sp. ITM-2016-00317]|uniref:NAD(P)-dependent alcohol dehydrogenase n=1 Tax=Mycobacterium sp. ITM-2016-00317 TaxID=2099694 RepID=UPI000D4B9E2A|nr:NAD(P)-dependent alcohol dehydrogenase [Mycobacterium sp. ITM-2016-00317]WNG87602.1 NAD(P)-dependent alcohol dehydrogenase [Mycobacterium sp. ITM-2016-00317]